MSVEQLKVDAIDAAQKYKARYKQTLDPNDLDMFKRFMDVYNHLDGVGGGGVSSIIAGTNITVSPAGGVGDVTISATTALVPDPTGYGSFYSNVSQPITTINTPQAVTLGQTYEAVGTSTSGSRIYMDKAGTYQFSYVAQVASSANSQEYAEFWIKYNGVEYPNSNTKLILQPRKSSTEPSEQLMTLIISGTSLNDNDYIELFWEATSTEVSLKYDPANASYPATPSIIANIIPIGAQGRDSNLNELNDVLIATPSTGQLLRRDSDGLWKNWTPNFLTTVPTLDQVTTAGNTTTNAITVGGLTVATNLIYTDTVGGRVGIGTTGLVPGILLTINGGVSIAAGQELKLDPSANIYMVAASSQFRVYTGAIAALSIANTGNVLINTTTDAGYKLDVNGIARVGASGTSGQLYIKGFAGSGQYLYLDDGAAVWTMVGGTNYAIQYNGTSRLTATAGGNIGIGTSTPAYKLQVQGTVSAVLTNATHADQVYYNSATGELTYGAAAGGSTPTLDQVTTAGNTTTNAITVDKLTINNGTYNASIGFGLINNPTANYFDVFFANNTGLRFGSPSFDGSAFQAFGGLHASYPGQIYFDYGSQQRTVANRSANFRNASSPSPVTVMKLTDTSNVLIGTTIDNGERLQVSGQVSADAYIAAGQQGLTIDIPTGAGQTLHFEGGILTNVF